MGSVQHPDRGRRLQLILEETGINCNQLCKTANRIYDNKPNSTSRVRSSNVRDAIKGTKSLSREAGKDVIGALEELGYQYNLDWLMDGEGHPTQHDQMVDMLTNSRFDGARLDSSLYLLGKASHYEVSLWYERLPEVCEAEQTIDELKEGCIITKDGKSVSISCDKWRSISNEVCDFVAFLLQRELDTNPAR